MGDKSVLSPFIFFPEAYFYYLQKTLFLLGIIKFQNIFAFYNLIIII